MPEAFIFIHLISAIVPILVFHLWGRRYCAPFLVRSEASSISDSERDALLAEIRNKAAQVQVFEFFIFTFFFFLNWVSSKPVALASMGIYLVASFALSHFQYRWERQFRQLEASAGERIKLEVKAQFVGLLILFCYFGAVLSVVGAFAVLALALPESSSDGVRYAILGFGVFSGLLAGMTLVRGLYPRFISRMIPCRNLIEGPQLASVQEIFAKAGLPLPDLKVLLTERFGMHNAMISGFTRGRGWFRPGLFVTDRLVRDLSEGEFAAVIKHEMSHIILKHGWQRVETGLKSFAFSAVILAGIVSAVLLLFPPIFLVPVVLFGFFLPIVMQMSAFRVLLKQQEFAADHYAVFELGASIPELEGALRKIDEWNGIEARKSSELSSTHPSTQERVRRLVRALHRPDAVAELDQMDNENQDAA